MFFHLSVSHSVHRGGQCLPPGEGVSVSGGVYLWRECLSQGCLPPGRGVSASGGGGGLSTTGYGQQAGGMHPTGMHSCPVFSKVSFQTENFIHFSI